jgi:glycosyltransferase involved in cell wall biosynthesis
MTNRNEPLVSIITPTYNHERFIAACIDSVLSQTYSNWEMIIVDDGSSDNTGGVVKSFDDPRIRYERQEHKGVDSLGKTYNHALAIARGELVAILEGDDWWPSDKLAIQVPDFEDDGIVISYGFTSEMEQGCEVRKIPDANMGQDGLFNTPPGRAARYLMDYLCLTFLFPVSVLIRKRALNEIGGFQQLPYLPIVDYPTFLRLSLEGRFAFHDKVLGFWRRHGESTTRNKFYLIMEGVYRHLTAFQREFPQLPIQRDELATLNRVWKEFKWQQWFTLGRWFLVDGEWKQASQAFNRCWPYMYNWKHPFILLCCLASCFIQTDAERLCRYIGLRKLVELLADYNRDNITVSKTMLKEL